MPRLCLPRIITDACLCRVIDITDRVIRVCCHLQSSVGDWPLYLAAQNGHLNVLRLLHKAHIFNFFCFFSVFFLVFVFSFSFSGFLPFAV